MEGSLLKKLVIVGASGHGKVVADIAVRNGYEEIVFLDDDESVRECAGFPVVGKTDGTEAYREWEYIVAIGNARIRQRIQEGLREYRMATLIHPGAIISRRVKIGEGSVVMAGVVINSDAVIGKGCIVNTGSSVDHDCEIGDYSHISVGAHVAGTVHMGCRVWIGAGAVVNNNLSVCDDCLVGSGAAVVRNISEPGTYIGIPARRKTDIT